MLPIGEGFLFLGAMVCCLGKSYLWAWSYFEHYYLSSSNLSSLVLQMPAIHV